nr:disease resistance protein At4g27190-like [Tanacetum cinerariifolium]
MVTIRCLLNIDVCMSWPVFQLDVNNAFLYGDLEEVVYMKPPEGYFPSDNKVCRLKKSLYGLKHAPRQWNAKLTSTLIENGFSQSNSISESEKFKVFLKSKFMIKDLGKLKYFLGVEVVDTDKGICLNQRKYVLDLLSEYGMLACKPAKTPLMSKLVISNEASENDPLLENVSDYQKLTKKLIYLTNTRRDISYISGLRIHIARTSGMFLNAYSDACIYAGAVASAMGFGLCRSKMMNRIVALHSPPMRKDDTEKNGRLFRSAGCERSNDFDLFVPFCHRSLLAIFGPVVESLMIPVKKHLGYIFSSRNNVRNMSTRLKQLDGTSADVRKHMETNNTSHLEIPARVPDWLEEVEKIKEDAERISSNYNGCLSVKRRYQAGRNAFKTTQEIERLIKENTEIIWSDTQKPLGKVSFKKGATSVPSNGDAKNYSKSREKIFEDALGFLQQDHKLHVIALCGMGGVGKTTMMEQLKKTVKDRNVFGWIVKVVIGQKINTFSVQQTVAEYIGQSLTETSKTARADRLHVTFEKMSQEGKKVLVILDDVWEMVDLNDIGLSPLPTGFKLLLTSRNETICTQIAVEANSDFKVVRVHVMEESEANNFFCQITGVSEESDPVLNEIGNQIVKRCGFLLLAIKLIATTLKSQEKFVWRDTLNRLKKSDLDKNVQEIIEISFTFIREEDVKAIFLLCGLFPDDFNIPIEDLTRYAWGLKLLKEVPTLGDARDRTKTCVRNLKNANLLIDSDYLECVKMHDLVLAFVLGKVSKGDHPWIINHGDISRWSRAEMSRSCQKLSLTCMGMTEFQNEFKYPNLTLLRLMSGDRTLKFPEDFYEKKENLEVIAYEKMEYPLLPRSLQCSTKLRTLILHQCLLMFDCSPIGDLLTLEVLSFAHCGIRKLPSTIGNLKELKQLDLTGCVDLHIDEGVFKSLVKLEELYLRVSRGKRINFTDANFNELAQCSRNLSALEIEFFENKAQPKNMSFKKLERFRISIGSAAEMEYSEENSKSMHSFENTLNLITTKDELMESRLNELFPETEVLFLEANVPVASGLVKLERLTVRKCPLMEVVAYSEHGAQAVIKFQELKFLHLFDLPMLVGFCNTISLIELPQLVELILDGLPNFTSIYPENKSSTSSFSSSAIQPFLSKEVVIPKLETLRVSKMQALQNIWPYQFCSSGEVNSCILREIEVRKCDNLVNIFPSNPITLLHHLIYLRVRDCGSLEFIFNIDVECVGEIEEGCSSLRIIDITRSGEIREVWRLKGVTNPDVIIRGFQAVERIYTVSCKSFRNLFTPTFARFDLGALERLNIDGEHYNLKSKININESVERSHELQMNDINRGEILQVDDIIPDVNVAIPFHVLPAFHHLRSLIISNRADVEVAVEIESATSKDLATSQRDNQQLPLFPYLEFLKLEYMKNMNYVWKCNWNKFLCSTTQQKSSFQNLKTIYLQVCNNVKYLLSPCLIKILFSLEHINIYRCDAIEEVVSNGDDEYEEVATSSQTNTTFLPRFDYLHLSDLPHLKRIDGPVKCSRVGFAFPSLCQYSRNIEINTGKTLATLIPFSAVGKLQKLEELKIISCRSLREIFEIKRVNKNGSDSANVGDGIGDILPGVTIPRSANMTLLELPNLKILRIINCHLLEHIFTGSTLDGLKQLIELTIEKCNAMQVIVKEDGQHASKTVFFPRLKSLTLTDLPNVEGFFFGTNEFLWSILDEALASIVLNVVSTFHCPMHHMGRFSSIAQNLEKLHIRRKYRQSSYKKVNEIFEVVDLDNDDVNEKQPVVVFPKLKEVTLEALDSMRYIWKRSRWITLNFPNLTKVLIDGCALLEHVFTCCMVRSLLQLHELEISRCCNMEVIVKKTEDSDTRATDVVVFRSLKSIKLGSLPNLKGFCLGMEDFLWPSLDTLEFKDCPQITVFTCGQSTTPQLKVIDTSFGLCYATEDPTSFIKAKQQEGLQF